MVVPELLMLLHNARHLKVAWPMIGFVICSPNVTVIIVTSDFSNVFFP